MTLEPSTSARLTLTGEDNALEAEVSRDIAVAVLRAGERETWGYAVCNPKDQFDRRRGAIHAMQDAIACGGWRVPKGEGIPTELKKLPTWLMRNKMAAPTFVHNHPEVFPGDDHRDHPCYDKPEEEDIPF